MLQDELLKRVRAVCTAIIAQEFEKPQAALDESELSRCISDAGWSALSVLGQLAILEKKDRPMLHYGHGLRSNECPAARSQPEGEPIPPVAMDEELRPDLERMLDWWSLEKLVFARGCREDDLALRLSKTESTLRSFVENERRWDAWAKSLAIELRRPAGMSTMAFLGSLARTGKKVDELEARLRKGWGNLVPSMGVLAWVEERLVDSMFKWVDKCPSCGQPRPEGARPKED